MKLLLSLVFLSIFSVVAMASTGSTYSGQEKREIKSLSKNEISGYLNGKGMGFSKVAELNHFPGPRHVLDLAIELQLSKQQIEKTNILYQAMKIKAKKYGSFLVEKEKEIESLFLAKEVDSIKLEKLAKESAEFTAQIRLAHLEAHVSQQQLLTKKQIRKYDDLRGYSSGKNQEHKHHH